MKTVSFITLGCKVNQYETEAMEEKFAQSGYRVQGPDDLSDVYVINTCTVTNLSDRKSRQMVRKCRRKNTDAIVVVAGCLAQTALDDVEKMPEVDIIIGTTGKLDVVKAVEEFEGSKDARVQSLKEVEFEEMNVSKIEDRTRANIKIQDGCNQFCSYCIIPYARGRIRSRGLNNIKSEAIRIRDQGYKEIVLTGIHVASYGKDIGNVSLIDAIETVGNIQGIERIRLSSIEERALTNEFLERAKATGKLTDHFHISLQSGSDTVLKRMNRKYTTSEYRETVDRVRKFFPNAGITTDIIVGFPEETEEEFQETLNFCKEVKFSKIHIFPYSMRKGTPATKMRQVDSNIKKKRAKVLAELEEEMRYFFMDSFIGRELEVLFEKEVNGISDGLSSNYIRVEKEASDISNEIIKVSIKNRINDKLTGI